MQFNCWQTLEDLWNSDAIPKRTLLHGPPGTGKSTWPERRFGDVERVALHEEMDPAELIGMWSLKEGTTEFLEGPAVRAMRNGVPLVLDEFDRVSPSINSLLHAILDDPEIASLTLPSGEVVRPDAGYRVIATMNANPHVLERPILDRMDIVLPCNEPHPDALNNLSQDVVAYIKNQYHHTEEGAFQPEPTMRRLATFDWLRRHDFEPEMAAFLTLGENGKELLHAISAAGTE